MSRTETAATPNSDGDVTGPRFATRERVHDTDDPHGILVVLTTHDRRCDRFELTDGVTVHSVNLDYPPTDRVVLCAYERDLDRAFPDWRSKSRTQLHTEFTVQYDQCPPGVRAYPASKLERYEAGNFTHSNGRVFCENCASWVDDTAEYAVHIARDCEGVR